MSVKLDVSKLFENGLACPFAKSDPERYQNQSLCHPELGWSVVGKLSYVHLPLLHFKTNLDQQLSEFEPLEFQRLESGADIRTHPSQ